MKENYLKLFYKEDKVELKCIQRYSSISTHNLILIIIIIIILKIIIIIITKIITIIIIW